MKKHLLLFSALLFFTAGAFAQELIVKPDKINKNDTVTYKGISIYPGKYIKMLYGSNPDKTFAFLWNRYEGNTLTSFSSNTIVYIDQIKKRNGKYFAYGDMYNISGLGDKRVMIDIQGAVDFKEIDTNAKRGD